MDEARRGVMPRRAFRMCGGAAGVRWSGGRPPRWCRVSPGFRGRGCGSQRVALDDGHPRPRYLPPGCGASERGPRCRETPRSSSSRDVTCESPSVARVGVDVSDVSGWRTMPAGPRVRCRSARLAPVGSHIRDGRRCQNLPAPWDPRHRGVGGRKRDKIRLDGGV